MRCTSQYCMVSARVWLWFVMVLVVTCSDSLAVATRMPVRAADRRAAAWFSAALCVICAAVCVESRCPCSEDCELPLEEELPPPPLTTSSVPPHEDDCESAWNELEPFTASLNAELKTALVDVSASADSSSIC